MSVKDNFRANAAPRDVREMGVHRLVGQPIGGGERGESSGLVPVVAGGGSHRSRSSRVRGVLSPWGLGITRATLRAKIRRCGLA